MSRSRLDIGKYASSIANDRDGVCDMNETGSCDNCRPRHVAMDNMGRNQNNSPRFFSSPNTETSLRKLSKYLSPEYPCLFFPSEYYARLGNNKPLAQMRNQK